MELCADGPVTECYVIDLGEILVFSASLHALRSGFEGMIAYDVDFVGPDGTYQWFEDINSFDPYIWCARDYEVIEMGAIDELNILYEDTYSMSSAYSDSIMFRVANHNLENRSEFLTLRDGGAALSDAHSDVVATMDKLDAAAQFIRNRDDESEYNLIKLADLTDLDSGLGDPQGPNFAKDWTRVEDVFSFIRRLMTQPVEFTEDIGGGTAYTWTMNLGTMYTSPVADWKELLPRHEWHLPTGAWIARQVVLNYQYDNGGGDYWIDYWNGSYCEYTVLSNIGLVRQYRATWNLDSDTFIVLLDPLGNPIDPSIDFPYFPDYTLNGLFPDMTRARWIELMGMVQ
jgi:hypothetical protein